MRSSGSVDFGDPGPRGSRTSSSTSARTSRSRTSEGDGKLRIEQSQIDGLEADCDRFNEPLEPLKSFVLPGRDGDGRPPSPRANGLPPGGADGAARRAARTRSRSAT